MTSKAFFALFLLTLILCPAEFAAKDITASGGGIVKPGDDLVLSYDFGETWDRCFWFWGNTSYCNFDLNMDSSGLAKKHRCNPASLGDIMTYSGQDDEKCTVTVSKVKPEHNGTWFVRVDAEKADTAIDVIVAVNVDGGEISVGGEKGSLRTGEEAEVVCTMHGGRPAPSISLEIQGMDKAKIVNNSQTQKADEKGIFETVQTLVVKPTVEDHNRTVSCQAAQFDNMDKPLFDTFKAKEVTLNVTFPPQPTENKTIKGQIGGFANISFVFKANPIPTVVKWIVIKEADAAGSNRSEVEIPLGTNDDKYVTSKLLEESDSKYRVALVIKNLTLADERKRFRLEATNAVGMQVYNFTLKVVNSTSEGNNSSGGEDSEEEGGGSSEEEGGGESGAISYGNGKAGLVFGILTLIAVVAIIVGSVVLYKRRQKNATAPLSSSEVRR